MNHKHHAAVEGRHSRQVAASAAGCIYALVAPRNPLQLKESLAILLLTTVPYIVSKVAALGCAHDREYLQCLLPTLSH